MNCGHHIAKPIFVNELICTAYSPKTICESLVNKPMRPMKSARFALLKEAYSHPEFRNRRFGEQVPMLIFEIFLKFVSNSRHS